MHPGSRNAESVGTVCAERRASVSCAFITRLLNLLLLGRLGGWHQCFVGSALSFMLFCVFVHGCEISKVGTEDYDYSVRVREIKDFFS